MVAVLCLARQERLVMVFVAYDCAYATNRVDAYSLLELTACPTPRWRGPSLERFSR
jgi:hypothetical protein